MVKKLLILVVLCFTSTYPTPIPAQTNQVNERHLRVRVTHYSPKERHESKFGVKNWLITNEVGCAAPKSIARPGDWIYFVERDEWRIVDDHCPRNAVDFRWYENAPKKHIKAFLRRQDKGYENIIVVK